MTGLRTLVVDDEPLARARLLQLLEFEEDVDVLAACADGEEAVAAIELYRPDLVFLDVRMPRLGGFEVLEALEPEALPAVVFVTAYDEYAIPAFEIHATDYLLKPVSRERFGEALARVRGRYSEGGAEGLQVGLLDLLETIRRRRGERSKLWIRSKGRIISVNTGDIEWVDGAGNYVTVHAGEQTYRLRHTLAGLEKKLDSVDFLRIHRSTIVNVTAIAELVPHSSDDLVVVMKGGQRFSVGRSFRDRFRRINAPA